MSGQYSYFTHQREQDQWELDDDYEPSPEEIKMLTELAQREWNERERLRRIYGTHRMKREGFTETLEDVSEVPAYEFPVHKMDRRWNRMY